LIGSKPTAVIDQHAEKIDVRATEESSCMRKVKTGSRLSWRALAGAAPVGGESQLA
jgi:hypothetical protein